LILPAIVIAELAAEPTPQEAGCSEYRGLGSVRFQNAQFQNAQPGNVQSRMFDSEHPLVESEHFPALPTNFRLVFKGL
jgi:hypothetical protein